LGEGIPGLEDYMDQYEGLPSELINADLNNIWKLLLTGEDDDTRQDFEDALTATSTLITSEEQIEELTTTARRKQEEEQLEAEDDDDSMAEYDAITERVESLGEDEEDHDEQEERMAAFREHEAEIEQRQRERPSETDELLALIRERETEEINDFLSVLPDSRVVQVVAAVRAELNSDDRAYFEGVLTSLSRVMDLCNNPLETVLQESVANVDDLITISWAGQAAKGTCYSKASIIGLVGAENIQMRYWVVKPGKTLDDSGMGGKAGQTRVFKFPDGNWALFTSIQSAILDSNNNDKTLFNTKIVKRNQRVGNADSSFGVSQQHGQAPGETIHEIQVQRAIRKRRK